MKNLRIALFSILLVWATAGAVTLVGGDQTAGQSGAMGNGTAPTTFWQSFVASGTGTIDHLNVHMNSNSSGGNVALAIYNSSGTSLLGYTNSATMVYTDLSIALVSSVSITSGTTYILAVMSSTHYPYINTDATTGSNIIITNGVNTFPTFPASLTGNDNDSPVGVMAEWGTSSGGGGPPPSQFFLSSKTVLIGYKPAVSSL